MTIAEELKNQIYNIESEGKQVKSIQLHQDDMRELEKDVNYIRSHGYAARDVDKFCGIPIIESEEINRLNVSRECGICKSEKVYHDEEEIWVCPFCEL